MLHGVLLLDSVSINKRNQDWSKMNSRFVVRPMFVHFSNFRPVCYSALREKAVEIKDEKDKI